MNVIEKTGDVLKLGDRDWNWLGLGLLGLPFIVAGLIIGLAVGNVTTLNCQRSNPRRPNQMTCQRTIVGLLGTETLVIQEPLMRAIVRTTHGTGVVIFISKRPELELANHRTNVGSKHEKIADQINRFIQDHQQTSLIVEQDDRLEGLLGGLMFLLPGLAVIVQGLVIPMKIFCEFNKPLDRVLIQKQYFLRGIVTTQTRLSDLKSIDVTPSSLPTKSPAYDLQLHLKPDRPATPDRPIVISSLSTDRAKLQRISNEIQRFLHTS
ncbi:MAG TPA: hypothetical protein V6D46_06025 [Coleofasciculaceae cyanobacterium]